MSLLETWIACLSNSERNMMQLSTAVMKKQVSSLMFKIFHLHSAQKEHQI